MVTPLAHQGFQETLTCRSLATSFAQPARSGNVFRPWVSIKMD
jgi:hypothetical protein